MTPGARNCGKKEEKKNNTPERIVPARTDKTGREARGEMGQMVGRMVDDGGRRSRKRRKRGPRVEAGAEEADLRAQRGDVNVDGEEDQEVESWTTRRKERKSSVSLADPPESPESPGTEPQLLIGGAARTSPAWVRARRFGSTGERQTGNGAEESGRERWEGVEENEGEGGRGDPEYRQMG